MEQLDLHLKRLRFVDGSRTQEYTSEIAPEPTMGSANLKTPMC